MTNNEFIELARTKVVEYNNDNPLVKKLKKKDVFVVWYAKTLQNHKALLGTTVEDDNRYFEATYNGDKDELYLDVYYKKDNQCYKM
ncbi:DUF6275 family protein [Limosilactobacillus ingluviei]|uniref:DUF6275 family protein n=1 Tax=Limosilactobacillus ingluviei TaxID=148604 RepID=UPI0024B9F2BE|nr:DUF6275 family protein [Limosilactobacillus ingluviei]